MMPVKKSVNTNSGGMPSPSKPAKRKSSPGRASNQKIPIWERDAIIVWLALTDNVAEAARIAKRSFVAVDKIRQEYQAVIEMARVQLMGRVKDQVLATYRAIQELLRKMIIEITAIEDLNERMIAFERFGKAAGSYMQIITTHGNEIRKMSEAYQAVAVDVPVDEEVEREGDKAFFSDLIAERFNEMKSEGLL